MVAEKMADAAASLLSESARWVHHVVQPANTTNGTHPTPAELRADIMNLMYIGQWRPCLSVNAQLLCLSVCLPVIVVYLVSLFVA